MIDRPLLSGFPGAMRATIEVFSSLDAMTDNPAIAMLTNRREHVDRAFEGIERVGLAVENDIKSTLVCISAVFARFHGFRSESERALYPRKPIVSSYFHPARWRGPQQLENFSFEDVQPIQRMRAPDTTQSGVHPLV